MSVFCPTCRTESLDSSRFCINCGASLIAACPTCGAEIVPGARFCPSCGSAIAGAPAAQETLKLATILFADVVGSTSRAEALHPEDVRELMASYFDAMTEEIRSEGGTVEKFIGDAIMAVFGVPAAHEDDPVRAVRAARRMLTKLHDWNLDRGDELQIRIGINTGEVLAGGSPGQDLMVTGDTVNVGARLQQKAAAGTILIGLRTARAVRGHFELKEVAPLNLKGKSLDVPAWSVVGERDVIEERGVPGLHAPMVGRDAELRVLVTALESVRDEKRPLLITIIGDAGVGKTRLVREFIASAEPDARVVTGRCLPYGEGVTLWPLGEILSSEVGLLHNDPSEVAREKILKLVQDSLPAELLSEADRTADALASTIGLSRDDEPSRDLDPQQAYSELLRAWRVFLSSLASDRALVVILEDIHWADTAMLDILDDLAEHAEGPILFLCPTRPDLFRSRPDWAGGRRNFSTVPLDPLTSEESALLASFLLEVNALPPNAQARILERAEGNPFFLEEIVRRLVDEGFLVNDGVRWKSTEDIFEADIPDTVHAVILARLDLLSPLERSVIQRAAVVGRTFWAGAVRESLGRSELDDILRTLQRRELVEARLTSSMAGEDEFVFKHILIGDVAYESLPRKKRAETHVAVAEWIERTSGGRAEELAEVLAHHYSTAFEVLGEDRFRREARRYYDAAARSAMRRFALSQAETLGRRSVELSSEDERVSALEAFGDLSFYTFQSDMAFDSYVAALDELRESPSPEPETMARLAGKAAILPTRWRGSTDRPLESYDAPGLIERGLSAIADVDSRERVLLLMARAFMPFARERGYPDETDERYARAAVEMAERLGDTDLLSGALDAMGGIHMMAGRYGGVLRVARRRLEFVSELDLLEACDAFSVASWGSFHLGRYEDGIGFATQAIERSRGSKPAPHLHGLAWRVGARFMIGDWDGALEDQAEIEHLVEDASRDSPPGYTLRAYGIAGLCTELRGRVDEANEYLHTIEKERRRDTWFEERAHAVRAYAHRGDLEAARRFLSLDQAMTFAVHMQAACDVYAAAHDWRAARELLPRARAEVTNGELLTLPRALDRLEGLMAADEGKVDEAILLLSASADGFGKIGAAWEEAYSNLLLAETVGKEGRVELYEGRLPSALATFQRLGSVREIDRARELMDRI